MASSHPAGEIQKVSECLNDERKVELPLYKQESAYKMASNSPADEIQENSECLNDEKMVTSINKDDILDVPLVGEDKQKYAHRNWINLACNICKDSSHRKGFLSKHIRKYNLYLIETEVKFTLGSGELTKIPPKTKQMLNTFIIWIKH